MTRQGGAHTMKWPLLLLSVIALVLSPGLSLAQSKTTTEPNSANAKGGNFMKDSWLTTKTKTKRVANGRAKARRITVESHNAAAPAPRQAGSGEERAGADEVGKGGRGVKSPRNGW